MVKTFVEFLELWLSTSSFSISLLFLIIVINYSALSIKRYAKVYYWVFGTFAVMNLLPVILGACGVGVQFDFDNIPILSRVLVEQSVAPYFVHPLLVIIMYMGALNSRNSYVQRFISIRKELSIIVGFAVIAHSFVRIITVLPKAILYFSDHELYMSTLKYHVSSLAAGVSSTVYILGVVMTIIFIPLWITSFDSVRRTMSYKRWKSIQRWSYLLYATLFIHATGIKVSSAIRYHDMQQVVEHVNIEDHSSDSHHGVSNRFSFKEVEVQGDTRAYINISIYILIYGSYLVLRVNKAKRGHSNKRHADSRG